MYEFYVMKIIENGILSMSDKKYCHVAFPLLLSTNPNE